jgi:Radical SAM superfamily/4Fe-4S single cluster domain
MADQSPVERYSSGPRRWKAFTRRMRELRLIARGALSTSHPIMAHIIPIRRCNLSCTYCNEYDDYSKPVPTDVIINRVNKLADLGTSIVTLSGGEPLLHPDLDDIIAAMRKRGVLACMITNGYLLVPERIQRLNRAGLDHMQISIDNVMPDDVSKKSLKVLDKKLEMLLWAAAFITPTTRWWWDGAPLSLDFLPPWALSTMVMASCGRWATASAACITK